MRKNLGAKPYIYPQLVLVITTYDKNHHPDAINAAWEGISDSHEMMFSLSSSHRTVKNILNGRDLTSSMATVQFVTACDYAGVVSANNEPHKIEKSGFHMIQSQAINAPIIEELPLTLECKMKSYQDEIMYVEILTSVLMNQL